MLKTGSGDSLMIVTMRNGWLSLRGRLRSGKVSAGRGADNRWFPGQPPAALHFDHSGWQMVTGEWWNAEDFDEGVNLVSLEFEPPDRLMLRLQVIGKNEPIDIVFEGVTDLVIDGPFAMGTTTSGFEVSGTQLLRAERDREDGRKVHCVELPDSAVTFASRPGRLHAE